MSGCTRGCGKKKRRETRRITKARRRSADKSIETEYVSGLDEPSDTPTESTEYQTLPGRSTPSERSKSRTRDRKPERRPSPEAPKRPPRRRREDDDDASPEPTPRRKRGGKKKSPRRPEEPPDDDYSTASTARPKTSRRRRSSASPPTETESETTESSLTCATVNISKFLGESSETDASDEDFDPDCEDEECGAGAKPRAKVKRRRPPSESSESWSETSTASSERCPSLCRTDPSKLPRRPTKCDSTCRRQAWLERQRDKRQAEMDDYLLRKGFRYFDDMCKCSLKCLMSQICVDPFARSIAFSTVGFFLGVKLCWELDGYYIPF